MPEQQKECSAFCKIVVYAFSFVMGFIVILLVFCSGWISYSYQRIFLMGNGLLLCLGISAGAGLAFGQRKFRKSSGILEKYSSKAILWLTILLIFVQIYICYNAYFYTEWDVAMIIRDTFRLAEGQPLLNTVYFSNYPNNTLLLAIFSLIKKADLYFGVLDVQEGIMGILCVQCFLSGWTGYLLFKLVHGFTGYWGAWCGWFCYLALVGTSGWLLIPYSDSMGLFFPTAILYLYRKLQNGRRVGLKWVLLGLLSCLGYHIKPQIFIVFIAVVIVEIFTRSPKAVEENSGAAKGKIKRLGLMYALAGIFLGALLQSFLVRDITRQLDKEKAFGMSHFAMMGLNTENNGAYLEEDVDFSRSFPTKAQRTEANMEVIGRRLREMGAGGLGVHLVRKLLTDYGDGTFAWKQEGNFFGYIYEQKNKLISPTLRNVIWGDGMANALNETFRQGIWLCVLAASLGVIGYRKKADPVLASMLCSMMGLTLFGLLFEARARYLYIYVPFHIAAGVLGAGKILRIGSRDCSRSS